MPDISPYLLEFNKRPVLISPRMDGQTLTGYLKLASQDPAADDRQRIRTNMFGLSNEAEHVQKPYQFNSGVAVIPVCGLLLNRYPYAGNYACGYGAIRQLVTAAVADPDVKGILFDCNSFGGMAQGCFELSEFIYQSRKEKPSLAMVDANAMSAAYALASAASRVVAIPSADVGSIGVVAMHMDVSKALDEMGIKITFIYAGDHKVDGNMYEPLGKEAKKVFQDSIDDCYEDFVACVARNRGLDPQAVRDTEAKVYSAEDAISIGLIDSVSSPVSAFAAFCEDVNTVNANVDELGESTMSTATAKPGDAAAAPAVTPPAAAAASAPAVDTTAVANEAKTAERKRINEIMGLSEAKERAELANHLALTTDLSPEACKGILAAAPTKAPAVAAADPAAKKDPTAFEKAMQSGNPDVPADGGSDEGKVNKTSQILKNYSQASGAKIPGLQ